MSVRQEFATQLQTDWADIPALAGIRVIATERQLDDVNRTTALIRSRAIGRAAAAPTSHRSVGLLLTLISAHVDLDKAEDQLELLTDEVLDYLDSRIQHDESTTVGWNDMRLAVDIPLTILASTGAT